MDHLHLLPIYLDHLQYIFQSPIEYNIGSPVIEQVYTELVTFMNCPF